MNTIYRTPALRAMEQRARAARPQPSLMERAGEAAAEFARELLGPSGRSVLILAGPGDNGGDAFEVATHLKRGFYRVDVVHLGTGRTLSDDARAAIEKWNAADGRLLNAIPPATHYDLVIDGLFGIGLKRPITDALEQLIHTANAIAAPRLALDIPSGLDADTGAMTGTTFRATHTITFLAAKSGLYTLDGPDLCGEVRIDDLGVRDGSTDGWLIDATILHALPLRRPRNFHKGLAGSVAIIGGADGMVGAALLAGRAALRLGAGKVFLGFLTDHPPHVDYANPELMMRKPETLLNEATVNAIAAGPGMGTDSLAQRLLAQALRSDAPLVLDADALNLIATYTVLQSAVQSRHAPTIMTPHPAEAARLLGKTTAEVQADRVAGALALAQKFRSMVVLKGNGSICAHADSRWWINTTGNAGMASAGMGDVLSGLIAALLAQGATPEQALPAAVYLHGAAGDDLVARGIGPIGLTASEIIDRAREHLNRALVAD
jgi:hydroxyethylthiazole kinase-like uncharacterized protein yjeF